MQNFDLPEERREAILADLHRNGRVVAAELSAQYGVSEDTIRRDLRELAAEGLLKRVHGGALPITTTSGPYYERDKTQFAAKAALARAASKLVQDGQLILFGGGTTNAEVAKNLPFDLRATVATISPLIALYLAEYPGVDVIQIGGRVNKRELIACDANAVKQLKNFQADICFLGVCSIHPDVGITTNLYDDVIIDRMLIEQSGEVVAAVTADKLGTVAPFNVAPVDSLTHIITENQVENEKILPYRSMGIQVIQADLSSTTNK